MWDSFLFQLILWPIEILFGRCHGLELDDDWRRWLFGVLMLIALIGLLAGFFFLVPFVLPKHGN